MQGNSPHPADFPHCPLLKATGNFGEIWYVLKRRVQLKLGSRITCEALLTSWGSKVTLGYLVPKSPQNIVSKNINVVLSWSSWACSPAMETS